MRNQQVPGCWGDKALYASHFLSLNVIHSTRRPFSWQATGCLEGHKFPLPSCQGIWQGVANAG